MSHVCDGRDPSCASCQAMARRRDTVRSAMTVDDELDDIKRARIWTQLEGRLAADAAVPVRRSRRAIAIGGAAAAAVVVAAAFVARSPHRDELHTLTVPVDTVVASRLGAHTSASIVGPAELELLTGEADSVRVRLHRGTLLAEFEGGAGRSLRIETRGALVEVVGTLFAVEARDGTTCTSVAHGRVRVTSTAGVVYVAAGERHCTGASIHPIGDDMRTALLQHAAHREPPAIASAGSPAASVARSEAADPPASPAIERPVPAPSLAAPGPRAAPAPPRLADPPSAPDPRVADTRAAPAPHLADPRAAPPPRLADPRSAPPRSPRRPEPAAGAAELPSAPGTAAPHAFPPGAPLAATPDELYRTAEAALAAHDPAAADRALAALVTEHPASSLVDQALYERARIAYQRRAWAAARSHLAQLAAVSSTLFAEPGRYLRCRIAVETGEATAAACLVDYRAAFPRSPHDLDALALLVQLAHARGGCPGAEALLDELAQSYPRTTLTAAWRARCPEPR